MRGTLLMIRMLGKLPCSKIKVRNVEAVSNSPLNGRERFPVLLQLWFVGGRK